MSRVVINACYGGFGMSEEAVQLYEQLSGSSCPRYPQRADPVLIQVVEELGERASDQYSKLEIVNVPDHVEWTLGECDGKEWITHI